VKRERVLITGSRHWTDGDSILRVLMAHPGAIVIHGGCPTGADQIADDAAWALSMAVLVFHADWKRYGRPAGPRRNQQMIDEGKPTVAYAFPLGESTGTRDMIRRLRAAGIPVTVTEPPCE
jgi:hypothetical protein